MCGIHTGLFWYIYMSLFVYTGLFWYLYRFLSIDIQTSFALNLRSHFRFARIYRRNFARRTSTQKKSLLDYLEKRTDSWTIFKKKEPFRDYIRLGREKGPIRVREKAFCRPIYVCMYVNTNMCICIFVCMYVSMYAYIYLCT